MPGSDHGPSIKCPDIYEALRRQGYSKEKSARISNSACRKRGLKSAEAEIDLTPDEQSEIWRLVGLAWRELFPDEELPDFAKTAAEATCKKEGDAGCFEKGDYAYTPSDAPFSWKIRLAAKPGGDPDAQIVGAAIAALGKGFRGNKADIPDDALPGVLERVRQAWRKANPDKDDDEMPDAIGKKASEFADTRSPDYLEKMIAWFQKKFGTRFDPEEYKTAHRSAMGHAGGKASARKRKEQVEASEVYDHSLEHPEPESGCQFCGDYYGSPMPAVIKMLKADDRVNYREATDEQEQQGVRCYDCRFYEWGACRLVEGTIEADDVCDLFLPPVRQVPDPPSLYAAAEQGGSWALFNELPATFAEAPDVVNVLPVPGIYDHALYGKIVVTPDRNARFVQNFDNRVYQQDLPVTLDIEHDGKAFGSVGYIDSLELKDDGSVDAKVVWTERGKTLLEADAFRYFSPEWRDTWKDPATGDEFTDVLTGGALTVRPFFKESALRPLVASEMALYAPVGGSGDEPTVIMMRPLVASEYVQERKTMGVEITEEQLREFTELKQARDADAEALKKANEQIAVLTKDRRRQRFTEIVRGKAEGSDGATWVGDVQANVESLERLADVFGEESDEFKAEVEFRSSLAKTSKEAGIFSPIGNPNPEQHASNAVAELNRRAEALIASEGIERGAAVSRIFREDPTLYNNYRRETRTRDDD